MRRVPRIPLNKNDKVVSVCIARVDDLQVAGKPSDVMPILKNLAGKVKPQVEGPFPTESDYSNGCSTSSVRSSSASTAFKDGKPFVRLDSKYVIKLLESLGLEKRKEKETPAPGSVSEVDNSKELNEKEASIYSKIYRSCVGVLLNVGQDRPDVQFAMRNLATAMKNPQRRSTKNVEHCALYLKKTSNHAVCYSRASAGTSVLSSNKRYPQEGPYTEQEKIF